MEIYKIRRTCVYVFVLAQFFWSASLYSQSDKTETASPFGTPSSSSDEGSLKSAESIKEKDKSETVSPLEDSKGEKALDYLYNGKPKDGTAAGKASTISELLGDKAKALDALNGVSNFIPPAFEAYLSSEESDIGQIQSYEASYDEAVDFIRKKQISPAMEVLLKLSEYPWDAGNSEQLMNRVLAIWDMRRNQKDLTELNKRLQERAAIAARNFDQESSSVMKQMRENERRRASTNGGGKKDDKSNGAFLPAGSNTPSVTPVVDAVVGKMELTEQYLKGMEARANIKLNEVQMKEAEKKARRDFADFIRVLHERQWHHQTKLAADLYRVLFSDGDLPVEIAGMATTSGEILQRVRNDVKVFDFKVQQNYYSSATKILQEDFSVAPNHPALRGIRRVDKLKVIDYLTRLQRIQNLIEARDFGTLDELLQELVRDVKDFDPTKPKALVRAVKQESQMRLGMAKLAAQQGNQEKALAEFKTASEAWPDNPALATAADTFFKTQDVVNKSTVEFDRAIEEANYRHVYERSLEYGVAVKGDSLREEKMKLALEKVKDAETALEKAKLFEQNGDSYGGWETLELATKKWPEDSKLNQRRADLSIQASEFVSKISKAKKEEFKGNQGVALAYYLNARTDYPASTIANQAIKRLSDQMLGRPSVKE